MTMSNPFRDRADGCRRHGAPLGAACAGCGTATCDECWQWAGQTLRCPSCVRIHRRRMRGARGLLGVGAIAVVALFGVALSRGWHQRRLPLPANASVVAEKLARALLEKPCDPALALQL